ncbi:hypothetical protein RRG08_010567 [Elysia crispata]|uniref:Uncharacterized protein n=1 Tax=Elysia crispata TaxID=231223 RepID=A0AAE0ZTP3_9GAST|nr:hypothetical protein RRG08_010567 [Elysia crispata]
MRKCFWARAVIRGWSDVTDTAATNGDVYQWCWLPRQPAATRCNPLLTFYRNILNSEYPSRPSHAAI